MSVIDLPISRRRKHNGTGDGRAWRLGRSDVSLAVRPADVLTLAGPGDLALRRLAKLIADYAPHDGVIPLRLPGTYALRRSQMNTEPPTPRSALPCAWWPREPRP